VANDVAMNQFSDNPYESPIVAELVERPRPKRWTPWLSFATTLFGPVVFLILMRYSINTWHLLTTHHPVTYFLWATFVVVWLIAGCRSFWWLIAHSWR
jgi:hypothetical protein